MADWACPGCQASADECEAEVERLREAIKIALSGYPRYSSIGGINNTVTLQFDRTRYERMRQLAQNHSAPGARRPDDEAA